MSANRFSSEEDAYLADNASSVSLSVMAKTLSRSVAGVHKRLNKLKEAGIIEDYHRDESVKPHVSPDGLCLDCGKPNPDYLDPNYGRRCKECKRVWLRKRRLGNAYYEPNYYFCARCGHHWKGKRPHPPKSCPACKEYNWRDGLPFFWRKELNPLMDKPEDAKSGDPVLENAHKLRRAGELQP
jgi:rubrerythrin